MVEANRGVLDLASLKGCQRVSEKRRFKKKLEYEGEGAAVGIRTKLRQRVLGRVCGQGVGGRWDGYAREGMPGVQLEVEYGWGREASRRARGGEGELVTLVGKDEEAAVSGRRGGKGELGAVSRGGWDGTCGGGGSYCGESLAGVVESAGGRGGWRGPSVVREEEKMLANQQEYVKGHLKSARPSG